MRLSGSGRTCSFVIPGLREFIRKAVQVQVLTSPRNCLCCRSLCRYNAAKANRLRETCDSQESESFSGPRENVVSKRKRDSQDGSKNEPSSSDESF